MSWGAVASIGVGLLSSKGSKGQTQSTQQQMDPAMRPYIFGGDGQKGLLSTASDQLALSRSPERMQGWSTMMNRGQQLMGGSVAGNPFSSGYQGGSNFGAAGGMGNSLGQYTPQAIPTAPAPAPAPQQPQYSMDDIMAEWKRRQAEQNYLAYMNGEFLGAGTGGGGPAGDGGNGGPGTAGNAGADGDGGPGGVGAW